MPPKDECFGEARATEDRGPVMGFLTTRVMTTEREPLFASQRDGKSIGQLIDARIEQMRAEFQQHQQHAPDLPAPELHSLTFEFPVD